MLYLEGSDDEDEEADGEEVSIIDDWCFGFVLGLQLQDDVFDRLPEELKDMLGAIFLYGTEEGRPELERLQLTPEQHESIAHALPGVVAALYEHFQGD